MRKLAFVVALSMAIAAPAVAHEAKKITLPPVVQQDINTVQTAAGQVLHDIITLPDWFMGLVKKNNACWVGVNDATGKHIGVAYICH